MNKHIKQMLAKSLILLLICTAISPSQAAAAEGDDVITIDSAAKLAKIGQDPDFPLHGHYLQTADLDLSGINWLPIGSEETPFSGSFDGNSLVIRNLHIDRPGSSAAGLFGAVEGVLNDVHIEVSDIQAGQYAGILTGILMDNAQILHATVQYGKVSGSFGIGSLAGINAGLIERVTAVDVEVSGSFMAAGGLAGMNYGHIRLSSVSDAVISGESQIGGLAGMNDQMDVQPGRIEASHVFNSDVEGTQIVGGLVGSNAAVIQAAGVIETTVNGTYNIGGLSGVNDSDGEVFGSYVLNAAIAGEEGEEMNFSTGENEPMPSRQIGGLIGLNEGSVKQTSVSQSEVEGHSSVGGMIGSNLGNVDTSLVNDSIVQDTTEGDDERTDFGGMIGSNETTGRIANSYVREVVVGGASVSRTGMLGSNKGHLQHAYAVIQTEHADGEPAGALVGYNEGGAVTDSFYDKDRYGGESGSGTALSIEEMGDPTHFINAGWNLESTWVLDESDSYPQLRWQLAADRTLDALAVSKGTLEPGFSPEVNRYELEVSSGTSAITVTASVYDWTVSESVYGYTSGIFIDGIYQGVAGSQTVELQTGENEIPIEIAAHGQPEIFYWLTVNRQAVVSSGNGGNPPSEGSGDETPPDGPHDGQNEIEERQAGELAIAREQRQDGYVLDRITVDHAVMGKLLESTENTAENPVVIQFEDVAGDPAEEVQVTLGTAALQLLGAEAAVEIDVKGIKIQLASEQLERLAKDGEDIEYRIRPVQSDEERRQVQQTISASPQLQARLGDASFEMLGNPVVIEANYSDRTTTVVVPLPEGLSQPEEQAEVTDGNRLFMFIEHSDGEQRVTKGTVIYNEQGVAIGLAVEVDKFSTFTLLQAEIQPEMIIHEPYISGYPDGSFKPEQAMTRAELAAILASQSAQSSAAPHLLAFPDVADDHWAYAAIQSLAAIDVMNGDRQGMFRPNDGLTRAEMAVVAWNWLQVTGDERLQIPPSDEPSFADVESHWAAESIARMHNLGLMGGYPDGTFKPHQALSRAEAVTVLNRLLARPVWAQIAAPTWADVPYTHWAFAEIESASARLELKK